MQNNNFSHFYSDQIKAFEVFYPVLKSGIKSGVPENSIIFGGGTALALYYYQHRLSFDIDIFITNPSYMSYFSPRLWIDESTDFKSKYIEQYNHIGLITNNNINVDLLVKQPYYNPMIDNKHKIFSFDIYVSSLEDIIINKIKYRKADNKSRDIFDIATAIIKDDIINKLYQNNMVERNDLVELSESLLNLNINKYNDEISFVEPFNEYKNIANDAPNIIIQNINEILNEQEFKP